MYHISKSVFSTSSSLITEISSNTCVLTRPFVFAPCKNRERSSELEDDVSSSAYMEEEPVSSLLSVIDSIILIYKYISTQNIKISIDKCSIRYRNEPNVFYSVVLPICTLPLIFVVLVDRVFFCECNIVASIRFDKFSVQKILIMNAEFISFQLKLISYI